MNIAIVAPSAVPFAVGGAENLWWGLVNNINQLTVHQAELIKLPSPEQNLFQVAESYEQFSRLDLTHFDLVISTKYPAWMVRHPNHVCYLQHTLRGLYDTYPLKIKHFPRTPGLGKLHEILNSDPDENRLPELFALIKKAEKNPVLKQVFIFPGPLSRAIVHYLDNIALGRDRIRRYLAISANVAGRRDYFPQGTKIEIIHHPSNLCGLHCKSHDYIFTASRLDSPKRLDLLITAYKQVQTDIPLKIAGTGPEQKKLQQLAGKDKRIEFLGFVTDNEMVELYSRALFVPYLPYDEDYGLITVESMASAKAVLTTKDAGGVNEFVRHDYNGLCLEPEPADIAAGIEKLTDDRQATIRMGKNALECVQGISWENTIQTLLAPQPKTKIHQVPRQPRIVVASTFPVFPPVGGGQRRIYYLYRELAQKAIVHIISIVPHGSREKELWLAENLREIQIPQTMGFKFAKIIMHKEAGISVGDIAAIKGYEKIPELQARLEKEAEDADILIASHPYLYFALQNMGKPVWYDAHNVEFDLKTGMLPEKCKKLADLVYEVEQACARDSEHILACSQSDADRLQELYDIDPQKIKIVPNGVDTEHVRPVELETRTQNKTRLGLGHMPVCLFIGSLHQPNEKGLSELGRTAEKLPDIMFLVAGSVCHSRQAQGLPANIKLLDIVTEKEKQVLLHAADLGLNPIDNGSGTNLKLLEYAAAGLPTLSTVFGARGTNLDEQHIFLAELSDWPDMIRKIITDPGLMQKKINQARQMVEKNFSWQVIGQRI